MWRLSMAPIDLYRVKPAIQKQLNNPETGFHANIGQIILYWPGGKNPLLLGLNNVDVKNGEDNSILKVEKAALSLSLRHLIFGEFVPRALIIQQPKLTITQKNDQTYDIGFNGKSLSETSQNPQEKNGKNQRQLIQKILSDLYTVNPQTPGPLSHLDKFEIKNASARLINENTELLKDIPQFSVAINVKKTSPLQHALGIEPSKHLTLELQAKLDKTPEKLPHIAIAASKQSSQPHWNIALKLNKIKPETLRNFVPDNLIDEILPTNVTASSTIQTTLLTKTRNLSILPNSYVSIDDIKFNIKGNITRNDNKDIQIKTAITAPIIHQNQFEPVWPLTLKEDVGAHEWLTQKLSAGKFTDLQTNLNLIFSPDGNAKIKKLDASFDFSNMNIDYRNPMPIITNASGHGSFDYQSEKIAITVNQGKVNNLALESGLVELAHIIEGGKGIADINLNLLGPTAGMFEFIENKPLEVKHGFDTSKITGNSKLNINIGIPIRDGITLDDIALSIRGNANNLTLPAIIKNTPLTSASANIIIKDNDIDVSGTGNITDQKISFDYKTFIKSQDQKFKERVLISGTLTENLRNHFEIDLSDFISGPAPIKATYTKDLQNKQSVNATADLSQSSIYFDTLAYRKTSGIPASASLTANINKNAVSSIQNLSVSAPNLSIKNAQLRFDTSNPQNALTQISLPNTTINDSNGNVTIDLDPKTGKQTIKGDFTALDLRPILKPAKKEENEEQNSAFEISLTAARLLTNENETIKNGKIYARIRDNGRFDQLELDAQTNDSSAIYLRYKTDSQSQSPTFRLEADNAGQTLLAFGLYKDIQGGQIKIYGKPPAPGNVLNIIGTAELTNFKVTNAPTLAKLLSLMSIEGLSSGITGDGIEFTRLETRFDWQYQKQGSLLVLEEGRTSGAAIGLTFEGLMDNQHQTIEITGTLVPLSGINKVIKAIPIIGDILTGGSGVIAATYKVNGSYDNPEVSINPLSVLTPGILRNILFE